MGAEIDAMIDAHEKNKAIIGEVFDKYDTDQDGKLDKETTKPFLIEVLAMHGEDHFDESKYDEMFKVLAGKHGDFVQREEMQKFRYKELIP